MVIKPSIGKGWPTKLIEEARNRSGLPVSSLSLRSVQIDTEP